MSILLSEQCFHEFPATEIGDNISICPECGDVVKDDGERLEFA